MMCGRFSLKLSFILLLVLDNLASVSKAQYREEKAFLSDFNQALIEKYARYELFQTIYYIFS